MLLFNKDVYAFLGDYRDYDANNMGTRIQKAWCSALGLPYPDNATLVNFPVNPALQLRLTWSAWLYRLGKKWRVHLM